MTMRNIGLITVISATLGKDFPLFIVLRGAVLLTIIQTNPPMEKPSLNPLF